MKIRSQINLFLSVSAVVLAAAIGVAQWTSAVLNEEMAEMARIERLIESATHLRLIATETVLFHEPRSAVQWQRKIADLREELRHFVGNSSAEVAQIERIVKHVERANSSYGRLFQPGKAPAAALSNDALGLQARVASAVLVITTEIMDIGHQLSEANRADAARAVRNNKLAMLSVLGLMGLFILMLWRMVRLRVLRPLQSLQDGTRRIADGDYAYRLDLAQKDEIGQLAQAFDAMTDRVQLAQRRQLELNADLLRSNAETLAAERDKQALLSTLNVHAIISVADRAGLITEVNDAFCRISGYSRQELLGQNHRLVNSGEQGPDFWTDMWMDISSGKPWRHEVCNRAKDGSLYWVDTVIAPFIGDEGRIEKYISIRTDISAHKLAQQALTQAKEQADAANLAKSNFLANMSHELRTPMNAILGLLTLLGKTQLSARQLDYTGKTLGAARSLLDLLNEILDFSKIEAGKMTLDPQQFLLEDVLSDLSVILSSNLGANKKVEILFDIDPELPPYLVGDALRLKQILINLSGNALKFTAEGSVVLAVKLLERRASVATLQLSVSDTGIGIAPENQQRIFSGFSQAESSTTRRYGGTGLGVAISQRLVALMGGKLELQSALGQGSCFYFTISLPLAIDEELPPGLLNEPTDAAPYTASVVVPPRILVVEDHPQARELLARMCASLGWQAELLGSGEAALERLSLPPTEGADGCPYDAIFIDWQLPGLDGRQTCQGLRALEMRPEPLLLALVTAQDRELLAQGNPLEQALLDGYLVKPVTSAMLFNGLAQARAQARLGRADGSGAAADEPMAAAESSNRRLSGLRLLVVEDNLNNQQVARELLEDEGATVQIANDGQEGVAAVAAMAPPFDLVLMDLQMPVMDGLTAARCIRQDLGLLNLPIVAMTANAMSSDREACLAVGMNDHIGKPFDLNDLVRVVLRLSDRKAKTPAPRSNEVVLAPGLSAQAQSAGVELAVALQRLGGKQEIYRRMLRSFVSDLAAMPEQLCQSLTQGDWLGATRQMHTLKGLAATLGAASLSAAAARTEKQLLALQFEGLDQDPAKARQQALDLARPACMAIEAALPGLVVLQTTMQAAMESNAQTRTPGTLAIDAGQAEPAPFDATLLRAELQRLALLLQDADMAAMDLVLSISKNYASLQGPASVERDQRSAGMRALDDAVSMLDFELAKRLCAELIEGLAT